MPVVCDVVWQTVSRRHFCLVMTSVRPYDHTLFVVRLAVSTESESVALSGANYARITIETNKPTDRPTDGLSVG